MIDGPDLAAVHAARMADETSPEHAAAYGEPEPVEYRCDYAGHGAPADVWVVATIGRTGAGEIRAACADHADIVASDDRRIGATVVTLPITAITYL